MDIPGASPPSASSAAGCPRLTVSLPEDADAVLSRTLLEQCCADDQLPNNNINNNTSSSPRPSLRREAGLRIPGRRDGPKNVGVSGKASWPGISKGPSSRHWRLVPNIHDTDNNNNSSNSPCGGDLTSRGDTGCFDKNNRARNRVGVGRQVSVLSVALRGLADAGGSRPGPSGGAAGPAEHAHDGTGRWLQRKYLTFSFPVGPGKRGFADSSILIADETAAAARRRPSGLDLRVQTADDALGQRSVPLLSTRACGPVDVRVMGDVPVGSHGSSRSASSSTADASMPSSASTAPLSPLEFKRAAMLGRAEEHFAAARAKEQKTGKTSPAVSTTRGSASSAHDGSRPAGQAPAPRAARRGSAGKGRRPVGREPHEDDSESDLEDDRRPDPKRSKSSQAPEKRRLACPFFKKNPQRYKEKRSCVAPGFVTVHRLK